jgi:hypothetical protein
MMAKAGMPRRWRVLMDLSGPFGIVVLLVPFVVTGVRAEQAAGRPANAEAWLKACARHLAAIPAVAPRNARVGVPRSSCRPGRRVI